MTGCVIVFACDDGRWFYTGRRDEDDRPMLVGDPDEGLVYAGYGCAKNDFNNYAKPLSDQIGGHVAVSPVEVERELIAAHWREVAQ